MGLRAQGLAWVLGLSLGLGGLGFAALTLHLQRSLDELETTVLRRDAQRLQAGLMDLLAQRRRTAQEWSHWSEMRAYVEAPAGSPFPQSNLTPAAIAASQLTGLAVLNLSGEPLKLLRAPGELRLDWDALLDPGSSMGRRLRQPAPPKGECGLAAAPGGLLVICQMPILDTETKLPAAGVLITADWVNAERLRTLSQVLALNFEVTLQGGEASKGQAVNIPGMATPAYLTAGAAAHHLDWTLPDLVGEPVALVHLDWPRELRTQTHVVLRGAQAVVLAMAVGLALAFLVIIDRRLVVRLTRLRRHLHELREAENWSARLPVEGQDELSNLAREGNHLLGRIDVLVQNLAQLSSTDALTGLANRRAFDSALPAAVSRCHRSRQPLSLAMVDVDHFKRFNDTYGHAAGDRALQVLSAALRSAARRAGDVPARLGGEEFVLLMEGTAQAEGAACAARLQRWLSEQAHGPGEPLAEAMTVSVGLVSLLPDETPEALLQRADEALYRAKANGRNRIESDA